MTETHFFSPGPSRQIDASPSYLSDYKELYRTDARQAGLQWFRDARYGLFVHYGLYSLLGRHEWAQFRERIPVAEYARLKAQFTADGFDAMRIAEFAIACGMRYVNLTARHHDGFCLWNSALSDFNSATAPARRDLVGELAVACETHGIGLCLYYSHGRDWHHPHAPNNDEWAGDARPPYAPPDPGYAYGTDHQLELYLEFVRGQIHELLTGYGPIAAVWLDGIAVPLSGNPERFQCQDLYRMVHSLQPQVLLSYADGLLGSEDFLVSGYASPRAAEPASGPGQAPADPGKPREVCATMTPGSWGYTAAAKGKHLTVDQVWAELVRARDQDANLLLNTGLLPDGSLDPVDFRVLLEAGERLDVRGWPAAPSPTPPAPKAKATPARGARKARRAPGGRSSR